MKKLVFSIQVFIVTLLAVQLTSCEGFPGPEPISEQYARPEEVIVPGVPVVKGDGKSIYQPTSSRDFRYAAAMIANSNGTMSAWFSSPGGTTGSRRYQSERFRRRRRSVPHAQQRQQRGDQVHIQPIVLRMDRGLSGMEHEYGLLPLGALPME